jgi:hypothetical protein
MAKMQGKDIQLKYLIMLEEKISNNSPIKLFGSNKTVKVTKTKDIQVLLEEINKAKRSNKVDNIIKALKRNTNQFAPIFDGYRWTDIDKQPFSKVGGNKSGAAETAAAEICSLEAVRFFIENNGAYPTQESFYKKHRDYFRAIWKDKKANLEILDDEWEKTFYETGKKLQKEVGSTKYKHYSREDGFMEDITKLVKDLYGIIQKDTWNPADIWLVANYNMEKKYLQDVIKDNQTSLQEFNTELRHKFGDRKIVGVSLKKLSGKAAQWELVNLDNMDLFHDDEYRFRFKSGKVKVNVRQQGALQAKDTNILLDGKRQEVQIQIKQQSNVFSRLRFEGTDINNRAARLGQVPQRMAEETFKAYKLKWDNFRENYPQSTDEFLKRKDEFAKMFTALKQGRQVDLGGVTSQTQFIENIAAAYDVDPVGTHSKMMQLSMMHEIFTNLKGEQLAEFWTDMVYNAQKKGKVFGPFGKVY